MSNLVYLSCLVNGLNELLYCPLYLTFRDKTLSTVTEQMEKLEEKLKSTNETLDAKLSQIQVSTHIIILLGVIIFALQLLLLSFFELSKGPQYFKYINHYH